MRARLSADLQTFSPGIRYHMCALPGIDMHDVDTRANMLGVVDGPTRRFYVSQVWMGIRVVGYLGVACADELLGSKGDEHTVFGVKADQRIQLLGDVQRPQYLIVAQPEALIGSEYLEAREPTLDGFGHVDHRPVGDLA